MPPKGPQRKSGESSDAPTHSVLRRYSYRSKKGYRDTDEIQQTHTSVEAQEGNSRKRTRERRGLANESYVHKSPSFAVIQDAGESIPSIAMQDRDTLEKGESEGFQEVATATTTKNSACARYLVHNQHLHRQTCARDQGQECTDWREIRSPEDPQPILPPVPSISPRVNKNGVSWCTNACANAARQKHKKNSRMRRRAAAASKRLTHMQIVLD